MEKERRLKTPVAIAFGNPLLDICVQTPENVNIAQEFGIAGDGESEIPSAVAKQLQERIRSFSKEIRCGGSVLNTSRVLQWLLGCPNKVLFSGTLGKDENAEIIRQMTNRDKVITKFAEHPTLPTGVTVVLVQGHHRSLLAHIGAAEVYEVEYLSEDLIQDIRTTEILLLEAYFCLHNENVCQKVVEECQKWGTCIVYTLSSDYLYQNPSKELLNLIKNADILLGNEREFKALANAIQEEETENLEDCLNLVLKWSIKEGSYTPLKLKHIQHKGKLAICTQGKNPVICCEQMSGAVTRIPVPNVEKVVDATGAGDSFASGVLLGILYKKDFITCCQLGMYASGEILQQLGCDIPKHSPQTLDPTTRIGALVC